MLKVCRLRTLNLVGDWCMRYQLATPDIKACEVGLLHAGGSIPCWLHLPAATQLVNVTATAVSIAANYSVSSKKTLSSLHAQGRSLCVIYEAHEAQCSIKAS